ncbi:MAG: methyltransferase family protein [Candidatus Nanopelagicaceae bacterium]
MKKGHIFVGIQFALILSIIFSPSENEVFNLQRELGWFLVILGSLGILVSMKQLGSALTALPESKPEASFVTSGLYKFVRHPIYSFLILLPLGVALEQSSLVSLLFFCLLFLLLQLKYRYEDRLLRSKWSEAEKYQECTPALFPKLRRKN